MHELGITQQIVECVANRANGSIVKRVVLEIGKLTVVLPDAIRFCFDLCAEGTVAQGAELEIREIPGLARCKACGADVALERAFERCVCGNSDLDWITGEELRILEMELV
jgi:hydrogenase nickel incorporation protein HypA/HybF